MQQLTLAVVFAACAGAQSASFEVATIKPASFPSHDYFRGFAMGMGCGRLNPTPVNNRISLAVVNLCTLIRSAYNVSADAIEGIPLAMAAMEEENYYAVVGQAAGDAALTPERIREMLRSLLAERFGLIVRRETRERPVYALMVHRSGSKLASEPLSTCVDGRPPLDLRGNGFGSCRPTFTIAQLIERLRGETDRPIVDRTGLTERYAFWLMWSADGKDLEPNAAPGLFTALQEQLGLRLEPARDTAEILVVERVHRPSEN